MKVSDRTVGYISFFIAALIIAGIAFGMWQAHKATVYTVTVDFDELGSLQPEDEVTIRGFHVGVVQSISWLGNRSRVVLQFDNPIHLRKDSEIRDVNYALMGQRRIEITPSKTGDAVPNDYVFQGFFEPGIAEALRLVEDATTQIETVREAILLIANGDSLNPSFSLVFEEKLEQVDFLLKRMESLTNAFPKKLDSLFMAVDSTANTVLTIEAKANQALITVDSVTHIQIANANDALKSVHKGVTLADSTIKNLEENTLLNSILDNNSLVQKTQALIAQVQDFIKVLDTKNLKVLDENGKKISLITWKNINLIGATAREKAKKRAELERKLKELK